MSLEAVLDLGRSVEVGSGGGCWGAHGDRALRRCPVGKSNALIIDLNRAATAAVELRAGRPEFDIVRAFRRALAAMIEGGRPGILGLRPPSERELAEVVAQVKRGSSTRAQGAMKARLAALAAWWSGPPKRGRS